MEWAGSPVGLLTYHGKVANTGPNKKRWIAQAIIDKRFSGHVQTQGRSLKSKFSRSFFGANFMRKLNDLTDTVCAPPDPRPDGLTEEELYDVLARHIIDECDENMNGDELFDYQKFFNDNNMTQAAKDKLNRELKNPRPKTKGNKRTRRGGHITDRG